jgi:hypothetical protein
VREESWLIVALTRSNDETSEQADTGAGRWSIGGGGMGQRSLDMIEARRRIVDCGFVGHCHRHQPATDRIFTNQREHSLVQLFVSDFNTARAESIPLVKYSNVAWPVTSSRTRASNPLRVTRPIFLPKPRGIPRIRETD